MLSHNAKSTISVSHRRYLQWVVLIGLAVNAYYFVRFGVRHGNDSVRYTEGATALLSGQSIGSVSPSYFGYVVMVAVTRMMGIGESGLLFIQILLSIFATLCLYSLTSTLFSRQAGILASLIFAANPEVAQWNTFVLTDGPYVSLLIISTWAAILHSRRSIWCLISLVILVLFTTTLRPHGVILIPLFVIYGTLKKITSLRLRLILGAVFVTISLIACIKSSHLNRLFQTANPHGTFLSGLILPGSGWQLRPPVGVAVALAEIHWTDIWIWLVKYPVYSFSLFALRVMAEVIHIRPFYSFNLTTDGSLAHAVAVKSKGIAQPILKIALHLEWAAVIFYPAPKSV